jgi:hypothetical protein
LPPREALRQDDDLLALATSFEAIIRIVTKIVRDVERRGSVLLCASRARFDSAQFAFVLLDSS